MSIANKQTNFYLAVLNAKRSNQEKAVRLSVCPFVKRVHCDKTKKDLSRFFIPYERSFQHGFLGTRMVGGGFPFYLKFWVN